MKNEIKDATEFSEYSRKLTLDRSSLVYGVARPQPGLPRPCSPEAKQAVVQVAAHGVLAQGARGQGRAIIHLRVGAYAGEIKRGILEAV